MNFLAVFLGGGLGALVRYMLYLIMPHWTYLPLATLVANFFGCFIATIVFVCFAMKSNLSPTYRIFLITGFCGGLSTLSALSLELLHFIQSDDYLKATLYILSTVVVCTLAVLLGIFLVKN
ncbi:fluoride efflux transporter CrcB [bacterium]|nr:fluoride efflux transporter CrcB [bacterium]